MGAISSETGGGGGACECVAGVLARMKYTVLLVEQGWMIRFP